MTGRIFYWNMTTFNKAGITEVPSTEDDLFAAGKGFPGRSWAMIFPPCTWAHTTM